MPAEAENTLELMPSAAEKHTVVTLISKPRPTPAGVVHDTVKVARGSDAARPLSTARATLEQGSPPMDTDTGAELFRLPTVGMAMRMPPIEVPLRLTGCVKRGETQGKTYPRLEATPSTTTVTVGWPGGSCTVAVMRVWLQDVMERVEGTRALIKMMAQFQAVLSQKEVPSMVIVPDTGSDVADVMMGAA